MFARFGVTVTVVEAADRLLAVNAYPTFHRGIEDALRVLEF